MGAASPAERNYQTSIVNAALSRLGSGWASWVDSARVPAPHYPSAEESFFLDPISYAIDEERRQQFEAHGSLYISEQVIIVQYKPPLRRNLKVVDYIYSDDSKEENPGKKLIERFKQSLDEIEGALSVLKMSRLRSYETTLFGDRTVFRDELVNYLSFCLTGDTSPVNVPPFGAYMDTYISSEELWPGITPRIGQNYIYSVALEGFPAESYPGLLNSLEGMAIPFRWSSRFIYLDTHQSVSELNTFRKSWKMKERGFFSQVFKTRTGPVNEDALLMASEAQQALAQAEGGLVTYGYYTPVIILMGKDREEVENSATTIVNLLKRSGVRSRIETVNAVEAFLGSLPGHTDKNVRRPVVHTLNLADMLPLASIWPGRDVNPCDFYPPASPPLFLAATTGSTPFRFNFHVGQLGHSLILGPTRSGKSTLLALCVAQFFRYPGARVTAFDKGNSLYALAHAIGPKYSARHYELGANEERLAFAPLSHLDSVEDRLWAIEWLSQCVVLRRGSGPTPDEAQAIEHAIRQLSEAPKGARSITEFCGAIQNPEIREIMNYYTLSGPGGHILDAQVDGLDDAHLRVFEIQHLMNMSEAMFLPVMTYIIQRFIRSLDGNPAMLVIDEGWVFLKDATMRAKVEEWLRVLAKANCIVVFATQSLSDAINSGLMSVLVESCPTKVFLPNPEAKNPAIADIYRTFGFTDTELDIVSSAERQRQYYVSSPDGKRLIDLGLGPLTLSFVGAGSLENISEIKKLRVEHGDSWPLTWARRRKCSKILEDVYSFLEMEGSSK
ncbi:transport secretion system IV VirB4 protein [Asaia spathodeae NBRC 105894]|nr:transport secretion system IV VirB4 protein [Asaia spathodeae NBRC 105894]